MIIKFYDLKKFLNSKTSIFLFYGQNVSLIEETINKNVKRVFIGNIYNYEESEVLSDINEFQIGLYNKSFFDNEKLIIINRVTDKILELIKNIIEKNNESIKIILKSGNLEKKSKLRNFFEKNKDLIILPFYEDSHKDLMDLALNFFKKNKIKISTQNINYILQKTKGNRLNLKNELEKIKSLYKSNSIIEFDHLLKIISSSEDYKISEFTDHCLAKNKNKTIKILNDNNFIKDDSILILKSFLHKLKRLIILKKEITARKDQDSVISSYKPTIFWKDKEIIKQQLNSLSANDIKTFIKQINSLELLIKKQTKDTAETFGLFDRGEIKAGMLADINIIDFDKLNVSHPTMIHDLPLGGRRLVQDAAGYIATIKNGKVVSENGQANGVLPGKLIRGKQVCEVKTGISQVSYFDKTIRLLGVKALRFIWKLSGKSMKSTIVSET